MEKWVLKNKKADFQAIMNQHNVSEVLARLLVNRNQEKAEEIETYLNPQLPYLHNPFLMKDMEKACNIILAKIKEKKKIRIVGDYDVDGIASTYILYKTLHDFGAEVDYEVPDRIKDGYGINQNIIEAAYKDGIDTIVTCDNGISALEQIIVARSLGLTVIITDHHDIPFVKEGDEIEYLIPTADAVVNPKQPDCNYPWKNLCGAAVAYKLVLALYELCNKDKQEAYELIEIVAIATVCDVMDLIDENRILVKNGIKQLRNTKNLGLKALIELTNINLSTLTAYHLGFIIGPCLNASGRLDTAKKGLKLLLSKTNEEAIQLSQELKQLNDVRKDMTLKGLEEAILIIENSDRQLDKVLVVYLDDCHESLAGIIAGRLRERYNKPAIVLTKGDNEVKGSCRSIEQYNIYEELTKCKDLLLKFGGHPMAAGLALEYDKIESLRIALNQNTELSDDDLIPKVVIDIALPFGYITEELIMELEYLEPFGKGNQKPVFAERNLVIRKASIFGRNANVLKLLLVNEYGRVMDAVYFGNIDDFLKCLIDTYGQEEVDKIFQNRDNSIRFSVTYYPCINEYGGRRSTQIIIQNYRIAT